MCVLLVFVLHSSTDFYLADNHSLCVDIAYFIIVLGGVREI